MPPKGKLPDATIATLEQWVKDGAVVPHAAEPTAGSIAKKPPGLDFEAARIALGLSADPQAGDSRGAARGLAELAGRLVRAGRGSRPPG